MLNWTLFPLVFSVFKMSATEEFTFDKEQLADGFKFTAKLPFRTALDLLERSDEHFLAGFLNTLKTGTGFKSYYFEAPPMTNSTVCYFLNNKGSMQ
jgi:hypothetical protein